VSQLGYMMMGLGVGGVAVGMFHLMTHAFFKALLFLGAGSVIHGCHDEQDIRYLGGLKRQMPVTFATICHWDDGALRRAVAFLGFLGQGRDSARGVALGAEQVAVCIGAGRRLSYRVLHDPPDLFCILRPK